VASLCEPFCVKLFAVTTNPELHQIISEESPKLPKQPWQTELAAQATELVSQFLENHCTEIKPENTDLTIYLLMQIVEGTIHSAVNAAPKALKNGSLAKELERMLYLYLTTDVESV
jgi:Tetracyclin repressor-like, C-terminal domain